MNCPYLTGNYLKSCGASKDVYIPTAFEMEEYCTGQWHALCRLYRGRKDSAQAAAPAAGRASTRCSAPYLQS